MEQDVLFARQPIFDINNNIYAFELLYRGMSNVEDLTQGRLLTNEVLLNFCTGFLEDGYAFNKPVFINVDESFLLGLHLFPSVPQNIVFEILETVQPTEEVLNSIRKLRSQGYLFAIDDYEFEAHQDPFLPFVSIVKVDVMAMTLEKLRENLQLKPLAKKKLLAEKVENSEMFEACKSMGFSLFQGYYLERPVLQRGKTLTSSKQSLMQLVAKLSQKDIEATEVANIISTDPHLVVKILKIVNCSLYGFKRDIVNVREAVVMLGIDVVKQWAVILSLSATSEQPPELFRTLLIRAKICELFALELKKEDAQGEFILGLFSGLDAVLGLPMDAVIEAIPFPEHIKQTLRSADNKPDTILSIVKRKEQNQDIAELDNNFITKLNQCYWQAIKWADELMQFIEI